MSSRFDRTDWLALAIGVSVAILVVGILVLTDLYGPSQ